MADYDHYVLRGTVGKRSVPPRSFDTLADATEYAETFERQYRRMSQMLSKHVPCTLSIDGVRAHYSLADRAASIDTLITRSF